MRQGASDRPNNEPTNRAPVPAKSASEARISVVSAGRAVLTSQEPTSHLGPYAVAIDGEDAATNGAGELQCLLERDGAAVRGERADVRIPLSRAGAQDDPHVKVRGMVLDEHVAHARLLRLWRPGARGLGEWCDVRDS